jgi:thiamine kinase-like enzyme
VVQRLHHSPPMTHTFNIFDVVHAHGRDAAAHGARLPQQFDELAQLARGIEAAFAVNPDALVLGHNDFLLGNVLITSHGITLLDFEYAGMNEPWFDWANLAANAHFDDDQIEELLINVCGAPTPRHRARLSLMIIMSELREGMWAVVQQAISTLDTDFVAYANERLDHCIELASDKQVPRWLLNAAIPDS